MLKAIPVEEAVGMRLAHDITQFIPGKDTEGTRKNMTIRKE